MKKLNSLIFFVTVFVYLKSTALVNAGATVIPVPPSCVPGALNCISTDQGAIGFKIPTFGDILTFAIRAFFIVAGLLALFYLLLGAIAWVTSGGNKENVDKARDKITAAVLGVILIAVVLAIIVTLEQVVFGGRLCLGLSCPISIPSLLRG